MFKRRVHGTNAQNQAMENCKQIIFEIKVKNKNLTKTEFDHSFYKLFKRSFCEYNVFIYMIIFHQKDKTKNNDKMRITNLVAPSVQY